MDKEELRLKLDEAELEKREEAIRAENRKLRELLWYHHGCPGQYLYGDDGELQCNNLPKHLIDFRRMKPNEIEYWLMSEKGRAISDSMRQALSPTNKGQ